MTKPLKIALTAVAVVAAAVGAATVIRALDGGETTTPPGAPASPEPTGHQAESPDPDFWNPDRMRSASPEDMPGVDQ